MRNPSGKNRKIKQSRRIPARVFIYGLAALITAGIVAAIVLLHVPERILASAENLSARAGFRVEDIAVVGRNHVERSELSTALNIKKGDPMVRIDLPAAAARIGALPWVEEARIEKRWPNKIVVSLSERVPLALWQRNQQLALIDHDGRLLKTDKMEEFHALPVLVGSNAPANAPDIFAALLKYPDLYNQVSAMTWVGDRRWDLHLKNGIVVKMAEAAPDFSLADQCASLQLLEEKHGVFERAVAAIDLRLSDRVIVQTKTDDTAPPLAQPKI